MTYDRRGGLRIPSLRRVATLSVVPLAASLIGAWLAARPQPQRDWEELGVSGLMGCPLLVIHVRL